MTTSTTTPTTPTAPTAPTATTAAAETTSKKIYKSLQEHNVVRPDDETTEYVEPSEFFKPAAFWTGFKASDGYCNSTYNRRWAKCTYCSKTFQGRSEMLKPHMAFDCHEMYVYILNSAIQSMAICKD